MTTQSPPAYQAPSEGNGAPPPSYNPNVQQVQPQQVVMQQPVQQPNVQYVDQYGNPIQAPQQQQQQQQQIQYVDQYGNPIQAPQQQQQQIVQPKIMYVDQNGNQISPPTATNVPATVIASTQPGGNESKATGTGQPLDAAERNKRIIAAVIGGISSFLLFVGLCTDSVSSYVYFGYSTFHCGWAGTHCSDGYDCNYSYSELDESSIQGAAGIACVLMLTATICGIIATLMVQPFCQVQRCCGTNSTQWPCPKRLYLNASIGAILTVVAWYIISDPDGGCRDGWSMGSSLYLAIIGGIGCMVATVLAK